MKKILLMIVCLLLTSAAFGQYGASHFDSQPQVYHAPDHPLHAFYTALGQGQGIVGGGSVNFAQGDRPVSDFPQAAVLPLGDAARELKKQHAQVKKARFVWEN
jgi:hypothetical protein